MDQSPYEDRTQHQPDILALRSGLLDWYDQNARTLPWRISPAEGLAGKRANPYHVWLSEIMLQQTTVAAVKGYFLRFLSRFPSVEDLAKAEQGDVLELWAGLGYYARARNLHACARQIVALGGFPKDVDGLLALQGIGPYTASAIAAIAFDVPTVPVDGNIERVLSRVEAISDALPAAKPVFWAAAWKYSHSNRPGDFAQALMDLGAGVCTPRNPVCDLCPLQDLCCARKEGDPARYPLKAAKKLRPVRYGVSFIVAEPDFERPGKAEAVWLQRRPEKGLLGGMLEPPGTDWQPEPWPEAGAMAHSPVELVGAEWIDAGVVVHVFTHFELRLQVKAVLLPACQSEVAAPAKTQALPIHSLDGLALPTLMRKALKAGLAALDQS